MSSVFHSFQDLCAHLAVGGAVSNLDESCPEAICSMHNGELYFLDGTKANLPIGNENYGQFRKISDSELLKIARSLSQYFKSQ